MTTLNPPRPASPAVAYAPLEIADHDGRGVGLYRYCAIDARGVIAPVGHCSPYRQCPVCNGACQPNVRGATRRLELNIPDCTNCNNRGTVYKEDPCQGHPDEAGACEHYRQFLIDTASVERLSGPPVLCEVRDCARNATYLLSAVAPAPGPVRFRCCTVHLDRESLSSATPLVGRFALSKP